MSSTTISSTTSSVSSTSNVAVGLVPVQESSQLDQNSVSAIDSLASQTISQTVDSQNAQNQPCNSLEANEIASKISIKPKELKIWMKVNEKIARLFSRNFENEKTLIKNFGKLTKSFDELREKIKQSTKALKEKR